MEPLPNFVPNEPQCSPQSLHRAPRFLVITVYGDENPRRARIFGECNLADIDQSDARIAKFTFNNGFNLLAQGFFQTLAMIFLPAQLHHGFPLTKTLENIRKSKGMDSPKKVHHVRAGLLTDRAAEARSLPALQELNKRIRHLGAAIIGNSESLPLDIFHQSVEIVPRIGDADHPERGAVPQAI